MAPPNGRIPSHRQPSHFFAGYSRFTPKYKKNVSRSHAYISSSSVYRTKDNDVAEILTTALQSQNRKILSQESDDYEENYKKFPEYWEEMNKSTFFYELQSKGYFIKNRIGEGSYSKVYFAEQKRFRRTKDRKKVLISKPTACKIIDRRLTSEGFYEKFLPRELDILQSISHPHIISIYSIFEMGPFICICMDFCPMGDLLERIRTQGALSEKRSKLYFYQLTIAIDYLHSQNISHRDIKCENVLIQHPKCIKLTDFGFSRRLDNLRSSNSCKTFCGSTAYAAPEVLKGIPYDPKLYDMWSLGCVLFIMLYGSMPYDDENILSTIKKQELHIIDFPEKKFVSVRVKNMISYLLHPDVNKRYKTSDIFKHTWLSSEKL